MCQILDSDKNDWEIIAQIWLGVQGVSTTKIKTIKTIKTLQTIPSPFGKPK